MKGMICLQQNRFLLLILSLILCIYCSVPIVNDLNTSLTSSGVRCSPHQSSALLQLKREFDFESSSCTYSGPDSYPKMKFWKAGRDCCKWEGVTCNMETGQVVRLDLSKLSSRAFKFQEQPLQFESTSTSQPCLQQFQFFLDPIKHCAAFEVKPSQSLLLPFFWAGSIWNFRANQFGISWSLFLLKL